MTEPRLTSPDTLARPASPSAPTVHWPEYGELLVHAGKLTPRDMERALAAQREMGGALDGVLVSLGLVSEIDAARALAEHLQLPFVPVEAFPDVLPELGGLLPEFLKAHRVLPLRVDGGSLEAVMRAPQDAFVVKALHLTTGLRVRPAVGLASDIDKALRRHLDEAEAGADGEEGGGDAEGDAGDFVEHLRDLASEAPVIRLVNAIIGRVIELRASDIHLEPFDDGLHVRYRVDGVLHPGEVVPAQQGAAVSSRVKLLAHLDIAERRLPQDGRIKTRVKGRELDLRVSTVPTVHGESVVMRVLDRASVRFSLEDMGFEKDTLARFNHLVGRPHGILLVTGPTGSGKTTTLYAALAKLDSTTQKIITVEDPVEYQLEGINQIQVHTQINLTFANALRSILRQDPDIIMIGEMRDGETAQIAVQSSLTGHLVLSTLHTNDASQAVARILDSFAAAQQPQMRQQLSLALLAVVVQQLVTASDGNSRWPAVELLIANDAVRNLIRRGEDHQLRTQMAVCRGEGMATMEQSWPNWCAPEKCAGIRHSTIVSGPTICDAIWRDETQRVPQYLIESPRGRFDH